MEAVLTACAVMTWRESDSRRDHDLQALQRAGYQALGLAGLHQAIQDSRCPGQPGEDARAWLAGEGLSWCELLGIGVQPGRWRSWLATGCPKQNKRGKK